jgi:demethylmenaquinone methyltransferase / 2-methoxy-6-polyprenyl-1,4-benzoquinol methylase
MTATTQSAHAIHEMFGKIAGQYDITNSVLSLGIHHFWKRAVVAKLPRRGPILDLCTGTGDLVQLAKSPERLVVGGDFCLPMLEQAGKRNLISPSTPFLNCDAVALPFQENSFNGVMVSFGIRNIPALSLAMKEIRRVLMPGGKLLVLEFGAPRIPLWREVYELYSRFVMPLIGQFMTGHREAYEYLPETARAFPCREELCELFAREEFINPTYQSLCGGIAYLYEAGKE